MKMSKARELRDKFNEDLKDLQQKCPHIVSDVMPYMWAPGHSSGNVRVCRECDEILEHIPPGQDVQYKLTFSY